MKGSSEMMTQAVEFESVLQDDGDVVDVFPPNSWGKLISLNPQYQDVILIQQEETLGRGANCTVHLKNNQHLSSVHCSIRRDKGLQLTFLTDRSTNGTFINGEKVGKDVQKVLSSMDEVSLLTPTSKTVPCVKYVYKERPGLEDDITSGGGGGGGGGLMSGVSGVSGIGGGSSGADDLIKQYVMSKTLGTGNFATVRLGVHKKTGDRVAIKCIEKKKMVAGSSRAEAVRDEMNILERVSHPHIIGIVGHCETQSTVYLVLEFAAGGELFDYIVRRASGSRGLPENAAREIFRQIADAVGYLHGLGISHRDLKPENILLASEPPTEDGPFCIKLSDFGLSRLVGEGSFMTTMCGTPTYLAPEVLAPSQNIVISTDGTKKKGYDLKVDVWSMGVILFILLSGQHPFEEGGSNGSSSSVDSGGNPGNVLQRICLAQYDFDSPAWQDVSAEGMDLVRHMLVASPSNRYAASQVLQHPFLTGEKLPLHSFEAPAPVAPSAEPLTKKKKSTDAVPDEEATPVASSAAVVAEKKEGNMKPVCKYGVNCYRKNPQHLQQFAHPWKK